MSPPGNLTLVFEILPQLFVLLPRDLASCVASLEDVKGRAPAATTSPAPMARSDAQVTLRELTGSLS